MKTLLLPAVAALVCVSVAFAKPEPPPSLLDGSPPVSGWVLKKLSPELRERVEAVQTKAMEEPGIREQREKVDHAAREVRDRVRDSMFEIDPGLREAIKAEMPKANFGKETKELPKGVAGMTRSERKETMAKRKSVTDDPAVTSARAAMERASTPAERKAASETYRAAMEAAMAR